MAHISSLPQPGDCLNQRRQNVDGTGVMRLLLTVMGLVAMAAAQNDPPKPDAGASGGSLNPVTYDANGWPIVAGDVPPAAPVGETKAVMPKPAVGGSETDKPLATATPLPNTAAEPQAIASGMQLDSPLHEIFRAVRSPGASKALGGRRVFWRLRIHGANGETIGLREVTHVADCSVPANDRLEHQDGRIYGRVGGQVFAQRGGIPWPTLRDRASAELALFGMHLRQPWCFGDAQQFVIIRRDVLHRQGRALNRLVIERRPPPSERVYGPQAVRKPRDRFEVLYEPTTGLPREFVHRFANTRETRRVLLEDWTDVGGVRMPKRRIYVDEAMRPTTTMELLDIQPQRTSARDFRLH